MDDLFIPFASLYVGSYHPDEMAEFDMVCFDYRKADKIRPEIVVWYRDRAIRHKLLEEAANEKVVEFVADNFDHLLLMLHECKELYLVIAQSG